MPKFGKFRIKNQLSCLIVENPALIPIQMLTEIVLQWLLMAHKSLVNGFMVSVVQDNVAYVPYVIPDLVLLVVESVLLQHNMEINKKGSALVQSGSFRRAQDQFIIRKKKSLII